MTASRLKQSIALAVLAVLGGVAGPLPAQAPTPIGHHIAPEAALRVLPPVLLWPNGAPGMGQWPGNLPATPPEELRNSGEELWNISQPSLQAYLPAKGQGNSAAVIVAPGGGFRFLAIRNEGELVARWLAAHGYAAFVLKYRVVQQAPGESLDVMRKRIAASMTMERAGEAGVDDGRQALKLVRAHAADYGIDPHKVGVVGFSAGGHVAGMLAHEASKQDRADFAGLIYGMPFTAKTPPIPAANLPFPPGTPKEPWLQPKPTPAPDALPPLFIAMAQDDLAVGQGLRVYYDQLFAAGYRPELHLYAAGAHGFGLRGHGTTATHWIEEFDWWMREVLNRPATDGKKP
jgi:acetyl esterase/lipase